MNEMEETDLSDDAATLSLIRIERSLQSWWVRVAVQETDKQILTPNSYSSHHTHSIMLWLMRRTKVQRHHLQLLNSLISRSLDSSYSQLRETKVESHDPSRERAQDNTFSLDQ